MKLHKKIIYILTFVYLFSFVGISSSAMCLCRYDKKLLKNTNECSCCKESVKSECSCIEKKVLFPAQPANNIFNPDINALYCQTPPVFDLLKFAKPQSYITGKNEYIIANKSLEILRTVVLLE